MYYVYMLISLDRYKHTYVGYSKDISKRLDLHNSGKGAKFTRGRKWQVIYKKKYKTLSAALKYEYILKKNKKLRVKIKNKYLY